MQNTEKNNKFWIYGVSGYCDNNLPKNPRCCEEVQDVQDDPRSWQDEQESKH